MKKEIEKQTIKEVSLKFRLQSILFFVIFSNILLACHFLNKDLLKLYLKSYFRLGLPMLRTLFSYIKAYFIEFYSTNSVHFLFLLFMLAISLVSVLLIRLTRFKQSRVWDKQNKIEKKSYSLFKSGFLFIWSFLSAWFYLGATGYPLSFYFDHF